MANKSRKKKQRIKEIRNLRRKVEKNLRRKAKKNLNKQQKGTIGMYSKAWFEMMFRSTEYIRRLFERKGEEGVRKHFKEFGPPVEALNSRGEFVPLGWAIVKGEITFFMTRFMVSDGNGGFMCRDCQRGYFECLCSAENDPPSVVVGYPRIPLVGGLSDPGDSRHPLETRSEGS